MIWNDALRPLPFFFVSLFLFIAALTYVPKYYSKRFGYLRPSLAATKLPDFTFAQFVGGFLLFFILFAIASELPRFFGRNIDFQLLLIAILGCALMPLHILKGKGVRIFLIVACFAAAALWPTLFSLDSRQYHIWKIVCDSAFGIFLMIEGVVDHIRLLRLIPKPEPERLDEC